MKYEIVEQGTYPALEVTLTKGTEFVSEARAMCWMDDCITCTTKSRGGILGGLSRSLLTGESFFQNIYSTTKEEAVIGFVPGQPGTIIPLELDGNLMLERGAYLASAPEVNIESNFQGLKGLFSEGVFVLKATGKGLLFFSGYGHVEEIEVNGEYIVDNGYAVAWDECLDYKITKAKKIRSFLFGDQLLMKFSGNGRLWVQSRSPQALADFINPFRMVQTKND